MPRNSSRKYAERRSGMDKHNFLTIEKLAAYFDGNMSQSEMRHFVQLSEHDEDLHQLLDASSVVDDTIASYNEHDLQLPNEIAGMNFELPDIENENLFSDVDSFWEEDNLYGKDDFNVDELNDDFDQINKNDMDEIYERTIGDNNPYPGADSDTIRQQFADTCAIKSQQIVLMSFGQDIPEEQLRQEALDLGVYIPGHGTLLDNAGDLLNNHGVSTHVVHDAHVYDLVNELAQGHKVIVGVDSGELWHPSMSEKMEDLYGEHADHALVVTGIDTTDPNNVEVIITDPGSGDVAMRYPMNQFIDAWHDSNCIIIATNDAPPVEFEPLMVNFDYEAGHIETIGDIAYETYSSDIMPVIDVFIDNGDLLGDNSMNVFDQALWAFNTFEENNDTDFFTLLSDTDHSLDFDTESDIDIDL